MTANCQIVSGVNTPLMAETSIGAFHPYTSEEQEF